MVFAYLRVSTAKQDPANQKREINNYAISKGIKVDKWVIETCSGKLKGKNRKLGKLLVSLKKNDVLIVTEISRLSRTLHEIMSIMGTCIDKEIIIYSTKDRYTFDNSINSKVLSFAFGLVAEIEHKLISQRTKEALALRKERGVKLGRKVGSSPKLNILESEKKRVVEMIKEKKSIKSICSYYQISTETFRKFRKINPEIDLLLEKKSD